MDLQAPAGEVRARPGPADNGGVAGLSLSRALGVLVCLLGFVVGARILADNSFLTHLATGELILERRWVPVVDPYSLTAAARPWTVQSWLISLLYATVSHTFGLSAIRVLHGLVAAAVAGGIWQLVAPVGQIVPRFALAVTPILIGVGVWSPRPLMFGLLAMVVVLQVIELDRPAWLLLPVMWLWANSHGSFPLAFVLLAAIIAGSMVDRRSIPVREMRALAWAAAGSGLAVLNPIGFRILVFPLQMLSRRQALDEVVEWQAPGFSEPWELLFLALLPLLVVAAKRGAGWRALLPAAVFLLSGLLAIRNIAPASVVIVAVVAPSLRGSYGSARWSTVSAFSRILGRAALVGLVVAMAAVTIGPGLDLERYPVSEVDFLERRDLLPSDGVTVIHREAVGNYLTFRYGDEAKVFIDDRFDFYPLTVTTDHLRLLEGGDYREILDRRGADIVLWEADGLLAAWLAESPAWRVVLTGEEWIVACRLQSRSAADCLA